MSNNICKTVSIKDVTKTLTNRLVNTILLMLIWFTAAAQDQQAFSDHDPRWSPDGSKIVFYSNRAGNFDIYIVNADGTNLVQLTEDPGYDGMPDWSPDGSTITFASKQDGDFDIYAMKPDGSGIHNLTQTDGFEGTHRWSPDGRKVAFEGRGDDGNNDIYIMNADGSGRERVTRDPANDFSPDWSPDGKQIYFQSSRSGTYQVYRIKLSDKMSTALTKGGFHNTMGSVSPEGYQLAVLTHRNNIPQIVLINDDGKRQRVVTNTDAGKHRAEFSPTGDMILYTVTSSNEGKVTSRIFKIKVDGTDNKPLIP